MFSLQHPWFPSFLRGQNPDPGGLPKSSTIVLPRVVHGDLCLYGSPINQLDDGLTILGNLSIQGPGIKRLPTKLVVQGNLSIQNSAIRALPEDMAIGGHVNLSESKITALPQGFHVRGSLDLSGSRIRSLPDGLRVDGHFSMARTAIQELPPDLSVGGTFDMLSTDIKRLPLSLQAHGPILPSCCLADIRAFLHAQPEPVVVLQPMATHHERMHQQASLMPFPDLWSVVASLRAHNMSLTLHKTLDGYGTKVERRIS